MPSAVLVTKNLKKQFKSNFMVRTIKTLKGIDLEVFKGETFGFIGHNGAGKTTTMKILTGLISPTSGEATVMGHPVSDVRSRLEVGFLPERPYFYEFLTARETLNFYGRLSHMKSAEIKNRSEELLDLLELTHAADRQVGSYSKGMLQRLGMAQAMIHDPHLIILDEPMSGLDPIGRNKIKEIIKKLGERGKTVFFSTHILSDVEQLCDRIALIGNGKIRYSGNVEDLLDRYKYGVKVKFDTLNDEQIEYVKTLPGQFSFDKTTASLLMDANENSNQFITDFISRGIRVKEVLEVKSSLEEIFVKELERMED